MADDGFDAQTSLRQGCQRDIPVTVADAKGGVKAAEQRRLLAEEDVIGQRDLTVRNAEQDDAPVFAHEAEDLTLRGDHPRRLHRQLYS